MVGDKKATEIAPPFLVFEGLDLSIYDTLDSIEADLEGVDVEDGIYEVFDSIGRAISLKATGVKRDRFTVDIGETHVDSIDVVPGGAERLYNLLRDHLNETGQAMPFEGCLSVLVAKCVSVHKQRR